MKIEPDSVQELIQLLTPGHSHVSCGKYAPTRDALAAAQELAK